MAEPQQPAHTGEEPYEQVIEKLTRTVEVLERGELSLDAQIERFEEGVGLVRRGQALLDAAERKVEILLRGNETAPFEDDEEPA